MTGTNFILRDIANELEKIRIILERAHLPAAGGRTIPDNSKTPVIDGKRYLQSKEDGSKQVVEINIRITADWQEGMNSNERDTDKVDLVKNIIKENIDSARCGIYFTRNLIGDPMVTILNGDQVQIDICYEYEYFEVFGLTDREQKEIEEFYWKAAREKR